MKKDKAKKFLEPYLKEELIKCSDIDELLQGNNTIYDYCLEDCTINNKYGRLLQFSGCYFKKVRFISDKNLQIEFVNCILESCDLSNFKMSNSIINQVTFNNCKLYGIDFSTSDMQDILFLNDNLSFSNFTDCYLNYCKFLECNMHNCYLDNIKLNNVIFDEDDLSSSELIQTNLQEINLSSCNITGIKINPNSLKGLIVNEFQALELASLLGIKIDR